jgi:biotin transport system substrate-specific component
MQSVVQTHPGLPHNQVSILESLRSSQRSLTGRIFLIIVATGFVAACAHVSLPLPFTPVPITLQNFAVILIGMVLGPVAGFSAMVLYLVEGASGLPVFTPYSAGGLAHLLGPNGGYLFSYPLVAAVAGWVVRPMQRVTSQFRSAMIAATVATLAIFAIGAGWLSHFLHLSISTTWSLAIAPFLLGEVVKITAVAGIFSVLQRSHRS